MPRTYTRSDPDARFDEKWTTIPESGCHIWTGALNNGYGFFWTGTRYDYAHRYAHERKYGPVSRELDLDHFRCDTRACCHPDHVRPATPRENVLRSDSISALNLAKTRCKRGHPFDEVNTYWMPGGGRQCRTCQRMHARARTERRRNA